MVRSPSAARRRRRIFFEGPEDFVEFWRYSKAEKSFEGALFAASKFYLDNISKTFEGDTIEEQTKLQRGTKITNSYRNWAIIFCINWCEMQNMF